MDKREWQKTVKVSCKQKKTNTDSSAYNVYCRKKGGEDGSCTFENCSIK